ncbi:MAG: hypothetical protein ABSF70_09675 [Terracidiphilus sp.]|jgi:hypothetical protein
MKTKLALIASVSAFFLMLPQNGGAQTRKAATFTITGDAGETPIVVVNGKSYVEIEALTRLTKGTLSFKGNQTILTLPSSGSEVLAPARAPAPAPAPAQAQASEPVAKKGLSTAFIQVGIEEMSLIREWRAAIVNGVENNSPVAEDWISAHQRAAEKNLALASAAVATDDDRGALPLLSAELSNMQKLSELYLAMRKQDAFISTDSFHNTPLEDQILNCAQGFVSMTESHEFQDQAACH